MSNSIALPKRIDAALTCVSRDSVPLAHAAMSGHFPGHPVVPAVVLLDRVRAALGQYVPVASITDIAHVKFIAELHPGDTFDIAITSNGDGWFSFECANSIGSSVATGKFRAEVTAQ